MYIEKGIKERPPTALQSAGKVYRRLEFLLVTDFFVLLVGVHEIDFWLFPFAERVSVFHKEGENEKEERGTDADEGIGDIPKNAQKEGGKHA